MLAELTEAGLAAWPAARTTAHPAGPCGARLFGDRVVGVRLRWPLLARRELLMGAGRDDWFHHNRYRCSSCKYGAAFVLHDGGDPATAWIRPLIVDDMLTAGTVVQWMIRHVGQRCDDRQRWRCQSC